MKSIKYKCNICGKDCEEEYSCNGAVLGEYIRVKGHKTCVDNVDNYVVIPNRIRLHIAITKGELK